MKLFATTANANINTQGVTTPSQESGTSTARAGAIWHSFASRFWAHTEDTSKTDTKSFEGLL